MREFNQAFTEAQANFPEVRKTKQGHNSSYAPLDAEVRLLRPVLMEHGLSFRHEVSEQEDRVHVRCILAHKAGHSESASISGPADTTGNKNNIQAIGSTVTYLRRYTFEAVLGLATTEDDDGQSAGNMAKISEEDANEIDAKIKNYGIVTGKRRR